MTYTVQFKNWCYSQRTLVLTELGNAKSHHKRHGIEQRDDAVTVQCSSHCCKEEWPTGNMLDCMNKGFDLQVNCVHH